LSFNVEPSSNSFSAIWFTIINFMIRSIRNLKDG
jgi:hypothetical protein